MSVTAAAALAAGMVVTGVISSAPQQAWAAIAGTDIYVDSSHSAHCSDTSAASGSEITPFCTIQAAANVAQPGATVIVEPGTYHPVTISASGLAGKPITFQGGTEGDAVIISAGTANGFLASAVHDIVISGFTVETADAPAYEVTGSSSDITINGGYTVPGPSAPGVEIDAASHITVSRGSFFGGDGVRVNAGASGVVITGNTVHDTVTAPAISVSGVPGAEVTGNTLIAPCGQGIAVSGGSAGASIENNVVSAWEPKAPACAGADTAITVASDSASGTTADYNLIDPAIGGPLYDWGGTGYSDLAAFQAATGQGAHDLYKNPDLGAERITSTLGYGASAWYPVAAASPAIDSANADAPGELATDQLGNPRADDPAVPNTGNPGTPTGTDYFDRGAFEVQGPSGANSPNALPSGPLTLTASLRTVSSWRTNGPVGIFAYYFDGARFPLITTASSVTRRFRTAGAHSVGFEWSTGGGLPSSTSPDTVTIVGAGYTPVTPTRILDTRNGTGTRKAAVPAKGTLTLSLPNVGGIPATAMTAVVMNVTVTRPAKAGTLIVFPGTGAAPKVSSLTFASGQTLSNLVTVGVSGGKVSFHNASSGTVQLIADLAGYYGAAGNGFQPRTPLRVLDTRNGIGAAKAAVRAGGRVRLNLRGKVPVGTAAVVINVAVTHPLRAGWLAVTPDSVTVPRTPSISFRAGQTIANQVIVPLKNGIADFYNGSPGTLQVLANLDGYYARTAPDFFVPFGPTQIDDSRTNGGGPIKPSATYRVMVAGDSGCFPTLACPNISAGVFDMTVTRPTRAGSLTVYPTGATRPAAASLDFAAGKTISNLVTSQSGSTQLVSVYNGSAGTVQLITDEYGYFVASS